jgi:hypothetical protein
MSNHMKLGNVIKKPPNKYSCSFPVNLHSYSSGGKQCPHVDFAKGEQL